MREGDYKLIKRYDDGSVELYNLANDLGETHDLAEERRELARHMKRKLEAWLHDCDAKMPVRVVQDE